MELIPTFKEKEINILDLNLLGDVFLAEHERLNNILKAVKNYGSKLTSEDIVKLIEYKEKSELYLQELIKVLEKEVNEEYSYNCSYFEFINHVQGILLETNEGTANSNLFISEVAIEVLSEITIINKILNHVETSNNVKLSLENISSDNSLLGILLEAVEDSKFSSKEEVIEIVKQEIKQLEEPSSFKDNALINVHEMEEGV